MDDRPRRRGPHPTALAFFQSFDQKQTLSSASLHPTQKNDASSNVKYDGEKSKGLQITTCRSRLQKTALTLGWRGRHSQSSVYPVTVRGVQFNVSQVQGGEVGEDGYGTGSTVWPASLVLLKYLEHAHETTGGCGPLEGKNVVDLGAGTALVSIGASLLGANRVFCTDGVAPVVDLARVNVESASNEIRKLRTGKQEERDASGQISRKDSKSSHTIFIRGCEVRVRQYQWGDGTMAHELPQDKQGHGFDVILVSDCILPKLYAISPLVDAIDELTGANSVTYISYEHRFFPQFDPRVRFVELATAKGLSVSVIPYSEHDPVYSAEDIEIWVVRRNQPQA